MKSLTRGNLVNIAGEDREKCRYRLLVSTLIKGINDDEGWSLHSMEWANNKFLHLRVKGFSSNIRACHQDWEQSLSEIMVLMSNLEGWGGQDGLEVAPILKIPWKKKACSKFPICKAHL